MEQTELERVAEAILFAAGEPVELERIALAAECDPDEAEQAVRSLMDRLSYERRGIRILRLVHWKRASRPGFRPRSWRP